MFPYSQKSSQALKARYGKGTRMGSTLSLSRSNLQLDLFTPRVPKPGLTAGNGLTLGTGEKPPGLKTNQIAPVDNPNITIEVWD